jgi:hypothetical protein
MRVVAPAAWIALAAGACGSDPAIIVEVRGRPALGEVAELEVTVSNDGTSQTVTFDTAGESFPATFSITAGGRTGPIDIVARGFTDELQVAYGTGTVDAEAEAGVLMLDPADFVVNTEYAGTQAPNEDIETNGFQLTAHGDVVTASFGDDCPVSVCNQFGRRFGLDGRPLSTGLGAGTNQFRWNQIDGALLATTGVASQADGSSVTVWDSPSGVACRAMAADGEAAAAEELVAADTDADVVSAAPMSGGRYVLAWVATDPVSTDQVVRSATISGDCKLVAGPDTIAGPLTFAHRPMIAWSAAGTLVVWIEDITQARFRIGGTNGRFFPVGANNTGTVLIEGVQPLGVEFVRALVNDGGYALAYYRSSASFTEDQIVLRRVDDTGAPLGTDTPIAIGADYGSPALARRDSDGALAVAWTQCDAGGDGAGCGVKVQVLRPFGLPVGAPVVVNTTTVGNQDRPSIAALGDGFVVLFADDSMTAPDIDGGAVRMRYIYPPFDDAARVIGARCQSSAQCDDGLVCGEHGSGDLMCAPSCVGPGPCTGGGTCETGAAEPYCRF